MLLSKLDICKKSTCKNCSILSSEVTIMCNVEKFTHRYTYLAIDRAVFTSDGYFIISKSRIESMMFNHLNWIRSANLYELK